MRGIKGRGNDKFLKRVARGGYLVASEDGTRCRPLYGVHWLYCSVAGKIKRGGRSLRADYPCFELKEVCLEVVYFQVRREVFIAPKV